MIDLLPYTLVDGIPTMRDSEIMGFYDRMVKDGTADIVMYDDTVTDRESFLLSMISRGTFFYAIKLKQEVVGLVWLNRIEKKKAYLHFCAFSNIWGKQTKEIGKVVTEKLIRTKNNGEYLFDIFIGFVPDSNPWAVDYMVQCGCIAACTIPNICWNRTKQESEPGTLIYYIREEDR